MKIEQFEPGFYRVRDKKGYAIQGVIVGGYGRWSVRIRGQQTPGFKTKILAAQYLINCSKGV